MTTPEIIDSHAHLGFDAFSGGLDAVLHRATAAGLSAIIDVGCDPDQARAAVERAEAQRKSEGSPALYVAAGLHPHESRRWHPRMIDELRMVAGTSNRVVAIGEMGLDHHYETEEEFRSLQWESFTGQMQLAAELDLPFVVHSRDAVQDTLHALQAEQDRRGALLRGVMHCFTGDAEFALACTAMGMHISFSGIVTYANAREIQEAAKKVPMDRILVETDCPYLSPEPCRGRKYFPNEPSRVAHTAKRVAELRDMPYAEFASQATANTRALFGL